MPFFSTKVPSDFQGSSRLDKFIASIKDFPDSSSMNRSRLKTCALNLMVNGKKAKLSGKVKAGDLIDLEWEENIPQNIEPENIPLDILYEDENICVVNKKQGMVTHPAAGNWTGTLVNALLFHWGRQAIPQNEDKNLKLSDILLSRRPGIVHRLDKDTSGIIITAKNRASEEFLHNQFLNHKSIKKEYIAICCGRPKVLSGKIESQIIRDPRDRKRFKAVKDTNEGKYACTIYHCFASYGPFSLMRIRIKTGRTHQIRVHMKYLGTPIMGDPIYGNYLKGSPFENAGLMLHAWKLRIAVPKVIKREDGKTKILSGYKDFTAPVPLRFKKVLRTLHEKYGKK